MGNYPHDIPCQCPKYLESMPDEVPYELSQDQLDWLRLIFAVYSGASVVEDGSRITGEVLQKFYGSWGLEPLAPEANSKLG